MRLSDARPYSTYGDGGIRANRSGNNATRLSIPNFTYQHRRSLFGTLLRLELSSLFYALQLAVSEKTVKVFRVKPGEITKAPLHAIMQCYIPMSFSMNISFCRLFSRDLARRLETAFQDQLSCTLRSIE